MIRLENIVIIATLNEEQGIGPTLAELTSVLRDARFVIVDGNSRDATVEIAKKFGAEILTEQGLGKGNAIAEGLAHINDDPKYIIFIDADFTYPAGYIHSMIKILNENPKVGMVTGNRFADL